jgi:hypothetical protein
MKKTVWLFVLLLLASTPSAFAQIGSKPMVGHFSFGWVEPQGKAADVVDPGWNFGGGVTMFKNPAKPFGIRGDFAYNWFYASQDTISDANTGFVGHVDDGFASMTTITVDAIWDLRKAHSIGGYFGLGTGMYSRYWQLTSTVLTSGIWCDPWTGWCYPVTQQGNLIHENDRLTKIGWQAEAAITFPMPSGSQMYLEVSYHEMDSSPHKTTYLPILLGWRW